MISPVANTSYSTCSTILKTASVVVSKVAEFAKTFFDLLQWSFLGLYGLKEMIFDKVKPIKNIYKNLIVTKEHHINEKLNAIFLKTSRFVGKLNFNVAHGSFYFASGVTGSIAALQKMQYINLGAQLVAPMKLLGNGLFGFASMLALVQNMRLYRVASKISPFAPEAERIAADRIKTSAIMGIISSLNYVVASALLLIGISSTVALVFGLIAVTTGCIKILYDYFRFKKALG